MTNPTTTPKRRRRESLPDAHRRILPTLSVPELFGMIREYPKAGQSHPDRSVPELFFEVLAKVLKQLHENPQPTTVV